MKKIANLSDEKLVELVRLKNKELYSEVVKRYQDKLLRYANYLLKNNDEAQDVVISLKLPQGVTYLNNSQGLKAKNLNRVYSWSIGTLKVNETGSLTIKVIVDHDFSFAEPVSFWQRIIPQVQAAEETKKKEVMFKSIYLIRGFKKASRKRHVKC